jgi:hypothetical protein
MANILGNYYGYHTYVLKIHKQLCVSSKGEMKKAMIWHGTLPGIF